MVDGAFLLKAMDGIREDRVLAAGEFLGTAVCVPRRRVRKSLTGVLAAAVLLGLLTATAFAAFYSMTVGPGPEEAKPYRIWDEDGHEQWTSRQPELELSFSTAPEGNDYFFRAAWLPEEANIRGTVEGELRQTLMDRELSRGTAYADIDWAALREAEEKALSEEYGISPEEAGAWYRSMSCESLDRGVLYQIVLRSPSELYDRVFVLGSAGDTVSVRMDETRGGLRELRLTADRETAGPTDWSGHKNYLFLYSEEEGWLLSVQGTADLDTLARIAEGIEIWKSGHISRYEDDGQRMVSLDVGLG